MPWICTLTSHHSSSLHTSGLPGSSSIASPEPASFRLPTCTSESYQTGCTASDGRRQIARLQRHCPLTSLVHVLQSDQALVHAGVKRTMSRNSWLPRSQRCNRAGLQARLRRVLVQIRVTQHAPQVQTRRRGLLPSSPLRRLLAPVNLHAFCNAPCKPGCCESPAAGRPQCQ